MNVFDLVQSTADAAFAIDQRGVVVAWNEAATALFGLEAPNVIGKSCHDIVCGRDVFGNQYCDVNCALLRMVRLREPAHGFEIDVQPAAGLSRRMLVTVLVDRGEDNRSFTVVHVLRPVRPRDEALPATGANVTGTSDAPLPRPLFEPLTARELEVLRLLACGTSTADLAETLFISVSTVRSHVQNILRKLEVHSKLEAVATGYRHGLI